MENRPIVQQFSTKVVTGQRVKKQVIKTYTFINGLSLNNDNQDVKVNMFEYTESTTCVNPKDDKKNQGAKEMTFSGISDILLTRDNIVKIVNAARARWKIENENFKALKSKDGYNMEHSYGHGKKNLCTIFGLLAILALLIDQVLEISCPLFKKALKGKANGKRIELWGLFKTGIENCILDSWESLLKYSAGLLDTSGILVPVTNDTS